MKRKPKNIVIAIPAYTGLVHCGTMRSVVYDLMTLVNAGDTVRLVEEIGNADIARCRSMIAAKFLASDATHLVMVDSDVCWESGGLGRLVDAGVEFVGGAYPMRIGDGTKFHLRMKQTGTHALDPSTGLFEVEAVPTGFLCLARSVIEKMVKHYPDSKFACEHCPGGVAWDLFDAYWETDPTTGLRDKLGEDYSFCRRWRDMGGKIHVVPDISMGHLGTKIWKGKLSDCFRATPETVAA